MREAMYTLAVLPSSLLISWLALLTLCLKDLERELLRLGEPIEEPPKGTTAMLAMLKIPSPLPGARLFFLVRSELVCASE